MPDVKAKLGETRIGAYRIGYTRPSERHVEQLLDPARARGHHRDPVAEQDRLVDRMGDEDHGLALVGALHQREQLLEAVWGYHFDPGSNVVDVCVRRLRSKLGFGLIKTVRGEGYQLGDG